MKIQIDKKYMITYFIFTGFIFSVFVGLSILVLREDSQYLKNPKEIFIFAAILISIYLILAFARGAIRFSAGDTKDDQAN